MKFHFSGQILSENGELKINIPFNVWEVCDSQGVLMISVNAMGLFWECNLTPLGKGYYTIPVTEQQAEGHMDEEFCAICHREIKYADSPVLFHSDEKNADVRMYPASTTKILTTYLALLMGNLDDVVTTSATALQLEEKASVIPLSEGEQLPLENLLYATMVKSGNDGANVIAETISGSIYAFAETMNQYAASIGCTNTHFVNPSGLHDDNRRL